MAGKVALLLWGDPVVALAGWCPLSPAGTQTTQLLVEPPWIPAVLWDRVTLTCQGSGTTGATSWYKGRWLWWQKGPDHFVVTESGTYRCGRPGTGLSPPVRTLDLAGASLGDASCPTEPLVLQVPARALLEGDTVTLRCRGWQDNPVTGVRFYKDEKDLQGSFRGSELSLPLLQLQHSGRYRCGGLMDSGKALVTVPSPISFAELFTVPVLEGPPELPEGSPLNLSCLSTPSPLRPPASHLYRFYQNGQLVGGLQGSLQLLVPAVEVSHSGNYSCQVCFEEEVVRKSSARLGVTVRMPVANATITPGPPALQVCPGDPVTLRCSVQVGSAPVTFTWLHNGHEVARGPLLELGAVHVGHSGTYQCVATNQLGQDGHRVFRALSPELALEVTPQGTTGHLWNTGGGAVLDPHVVGTEGAGGEYRGDRDTSRMGVTPTQVPNQGVSHMDPQSPPRGDHEELSRPHGRQRDPSDSYENIL
uniref:Ig-like domain-containing protein n=1 Tax=Catharus ustulatus TaxID=91951 RepID=A0A8C3ULN9_CATUS